jgi:hypothetical protein
MKFYPAYGSLGFTSCFARRQRNLKQRLCQCLHREVSKACSPVNCHDQALGAREHLVDWLGDLHKELPTPFTFGLLPAKVVEVRHALQG